MLKLHLHQVNANQTEDHQNRQFFIDDILVSYDTFFYCGAYIYINHNDILQLIFINYTVLCNIYGCNNLRKMEPLLKILITFLILHICNKILREGCKEFINLQSTTIGFVESTIQQKLA